MLLPPSSVPTQTNGTSTQTNSGSVLVSVRISGFISPAQKPNGK